MEQGGSTSTTTSKYAGVLRGAKYWLKYHCTLYCCTTTSRSTVLAVVLREVLVLYVVRTYVLYSRQYILYHVLLYSTTSFEVIHKTQIDI